MPIRPGSAKPAPEVSAGLDLRWHTRHLLLAPHRLAFFLAMILLVVSGLWWAWVQGSRFVETPVRSAAAPIPLVHAALMVFGFFPLFFSGFLFTAGPKWLRVEPWPVKSLCMPFLFLSAGWLLWLGASHSGPAVASAGLFLAVSGMAWICALFWHLLLRSQAEDQIHARTVGLAFVFGATCAAGLAISAVWGEWALGRNFVLSALWGFVATVFVTVAHRMLPFYSPPGPQQAHPWGGLALLVGAAGFEAFAVWVDAGVVGTSLASGWNLLHGALEVALGSVLLWRAWGWAKRQSLRNRLLRMFYISFVWLGLAFVLHGAARGGALAGAPDGQLGALHALTMGCLSSLMLAMVTRVSCGHSGRSRVADQVLWILFLLLQLATLLRVAAALGGGWAPAFLVVAALLWAAITLIWALRLGSWYGRLRRDGRPG